MITGFSIIVVIWSGGTKVINGTVTIGELTAFITYLGMLIWPMIAFGWVANIIQQGAASMKRLNVILQEKSDIVNPIDGHDTEIEIKGEIEFKNVSFKYNKHSPKILNNISFSIPAGSTIAILGKTGVGKTSLINLIPRLYDVTDGEIIIDGRNIKEIPLSVLRKSIGLVPQETFLFSNTLEHNIAYGTKIYRNEDVISASKLAMLHKDVEDFPNSYKTILGERGITLSGGQKQRASLARALAVNPKILILDDSFSAVDTNTEEEILSNLRIMMKEITNIIISHRISTVKNADRIFVLESAQIAEEGTHEELLLLNGLYANLYQKQLLEEELKEMN
jgi:ATP-binding cassette subfamily B protein